MGLERSDLRALAERCRNNIQKLSIYIYVIYVYKIYKHVNRCNVMSCKNRNATEAHIMHILDAIQCTAMQCQCNAMQCTVVWCNAMCECIYAYYVVGPRLIDGCESKRMFSSFASPPAPIAHAQSCPRTHAGDTDGKTARSRACQWHAQLQRLRRHSAHTRSRTPRTFRAQTLRPQLGVALPCLDIVHVFAACLAYPLVIGLAHTFTPAEESRAWRQCPGCPAWCYFRELHGAGFLGGGFKPRRTNGCAVHFRSRMSWWQRVLVCHLRYSVQEVRARPLALQSAHGVRRLCRLWRKSVEESDLVWIRCSGSLRDPDRGFLHLKRVFGQMAFYPWTDLRRGLCCTDQTPASASFQLPGRGIQKFGTLRSRAIDKCGALMSFPLYIERTWFDLMSRQFA